MSNERGWVIEYVLNGGSLYYGAKPCLVSSADAIRFSREEDATRFASFNKKHLEVGEIKPIVSEHMWIAKAIATKGNKS